MSQSRNDREWVVMRDEFESEEEFRRAVVEELAGLENMGHRGGGAFVTTPLRAPQDVDYGAAGLPQTAYVTLGWHFKLVFMPAARRAPVQPEPEREPEPEFIEPEPVAEPVSS